MQLEQLDDKKEPQRRQRNGTGRGAIAGPGDDERVTK